VSERRNVIGFRLEAPGQSSPLQLRLNGPEYAALVEAARGRVLATLVRELVTASVPAWIGEPPGWSVRVNLIASKHEISAAEYVRRVVMGAIRFAPLEARIAAAEKAL